MKLTICIATYKRQHYLELLLKAIDLQINSINASISVTISDNDPAGSSEEIVSTVKQVVSFPIRYSIEKRKGISQNRNNSVQMADADTDFILFVDDDELPANTWIESLLNVQRQTDADVVSGLSLPRFVSPAPVWIEKGGFHTRSIYKKVQNGSPLSPRNVMTGTLLVRFSALKKLTGPFDEKFGLTGGEDSDLGRRLSANGCKMVWAKDAVVWEWIPDERATLPWILQRAYRTANTVALLDGRLSVKAKIYTFLFSLARITTSIIFLLPALVISLFGGFHWLIHLVRIGFRGVGALAGLFGMAYEEYNVTKTLSASVMQPRLTN